MDVCDRLHIGKTLGNFQKSDSKNKNNVRIAWDLLQVQKSWLVGLLVR